MANVVPKRIDKYHKDWKTAMNTYRAVHWFLVALGIISSVIVAAQVTFLEPIAIGIFSIVAAASIGLVSGLDTGERAKKLNKAWVILNSAIMRYEKGLIDDQKLFEAYDDGEKVITEEA